MRNYSKQREEILEILNSPGLHLTAEEIYERVRPLDKTISKGTVYRNLKELTLDGILWKISMKDGIMKYDYPKKKHNHVICSKCGNVKDFCYDFDSKKLGLIIKKEANMETDFESIIVYGICNDCKS